MAAGRMGGRAGARQTAQWPRARPCGLGRRGQDATRDGAASWHGEAGEAWVVVVEGGRVIAAAVYIIKGS